MDSHVNRNKINFYISSYLQMFFWIPSSLIIIDMYSKNSFDNYTFYASNIEDFSDSKDKRGDPLS